MASQRDTFFVNYPAERVLGAALEALKATGVRVQEVDEEARTIQAQKGLSWKSWGQRVTVMVYPLSNAQSAVRIGTRERFQAVDWGRGADTIDAFEAALYAQLEQ